MPAYCIPSFSPVPGSSATALDWWTKPPAEPLGNYPEDPDWRGCFSLGDGGGTQNHVQFRAESGVEGIEHFLYLSWVVLAQPNPPQPNFDGLNLLVGDGTHYIALKMRLATDAKTISGDQTLAYSLESYDYTVATGLSAHALTRPWATEKGRAWIVYPSPISTLTPTPVIPWAFQLRIPLGVNLAPAGSPAVTLPLDASFKLWYQLNVYVNAIANVVAYPWPGTPFATSELDFIPAGLVPVDVALSGFAGGCLPGVSLTYSGIGIEDVVTGAIRDEIQLDLVGVPPDVTLSKHQNRFFARPSGVAGLSATQRGSLRARFRLANWGTQYSIPTPNSWKIVPGGEEAFYQAAIPPFGEEFAFVWPKPGMDPNGVAFTTTFINGVKLFNSTGGASGQNPHQCMLVEMWSTNGSVIFTTSSWYNNLRAVNASVVREVAEVSVVGNPPISPQPRDVYLYLQTKGLPQVVEPENPDNTNPDNTNPDNTNPDNTNPDNTNPKFQEGLRGVERGDLFDYLSTYQVHAYYDTGEKLQLKDGSKIGILRPQTSFGYVVSHEGSLVGWETRIYGAEKITDDLYVVRVPNHGAVKVTTAIQARESANENPLPPDGIPPLTSCQALAAWLDSLGFIGRLLARFVRLLCGSLGGLWWIGVVVLVAVIVGLVFLLI
jgi:hypothetical protein